MIGIYAIHNIINDKYYIGQAVDINNRWIQHRSRLKCGTHENSHLLSAYNKYGKEAFEYLIIEECNKEDLDDREQFYIFKFDSYNNGYNKDLGGKGCRGYKHSEEEILKMRMIQNPKAVLQFDMELNLINEWISASHAGKTLGLSTRGIKACCDRVNRQKTIGGFYWIYKEEYDSNTVNWDYYLFINKSDPKRVSQYDRKMNLIKVWNSVYEAKVKGGFSAGEISSVANYKKATHKDYVWRYTDTYTQQQYLDDIKKMESLKSTKVKIIEKFDINGVFICEFKSFSQAKKEDHIDGRTLNKCLNGEKESHNGYIYKLKVQ